MINPTVIQTGKDRTNKGLYESFYFRGNADDGKSFWLKHNLMLFKNDDKVRFESTVIVFDKNSGTAKSYKHEEFVPLDEFENLKKEMGADWEHFHFEFKDGHMKITPHELAGEFKTEDGKSITWNLKTDYSKETYYHFSDDKFYHIGFPKKKILTKDIAVSYDGVITTPELEMNSSFKGMNGHNWGTEHAYKYAYANCNQFSEDADAYFDGFSAKIAMAGGIIKSPYLSACSVKIDGKWYHFNEVLGSWKHKAKTLTMKKWATAFYNDDYILEVEIDGESVPWVTLSYDHPSYKKSNVHNTKFAKGALKLMNRKDHSEVKTLTSDWFELESLIP